MVDLPVRCPICGREMERGKLEALAASGSLIQGVLVNWRTPKKRWSSENLGIGYLTVHFEGVRCQFCNIIIFHYRKRRKAPLTVEAMYERLVEMYNRSYGRGKHLVDRKIERYIREGLTREEAIKKLAKEDGLLD